MGIVLAGKGAGFACRAAGGEQAGTTQSVEVESGTRTSEDRFRNSPEASRNSDPQRVNYLNKVNVCGNVSDFLADRVHTCNHPSVSSACAHLLQAFGVRGLNEWAVGQRVY